MSFHSKDFSVLEIAINFSLSIELTAIANSDLQTITSSNIQKFEIPFGKVFVTNIAIFPQTFNLSSFNFIIQESIQVFVFFDSHTIIQADCHRLFFTV